MSGPHEMDRSFFIDPCNIFSNSGIYYILNNLTIIIMKRFFAIAAAVVAALGLTSCEPEMSKAIVGTWEATTVEMSMEGMSMTMDIKELGVGMTFKFMENGTGTVTENVSGESATEIFTYVIDGGMLTMDMSGDVGTIPVTIDGKKMTMIFDGEMLEEPGATAKIHFVKK